MMRILFIRDDDQGVDQVLEGSGEGMIGGIQGDTKLAVGDLITKETTFNQNSTSILDKISNIARVTTPPRTPPHLETGAAFS